MTTVQTDRQSGTGLGSALVHALAKNWWLLLLRGIAAIIFGVLAFAWPGLTLLTLILFYGAFALVDGVLAIIAAITGGAPAPRWWLAIVGLLGIAAGLLTFLMPGLSALVLLFFIAGWAIATGVLQIIAQGDRQRVAPDPWRRHLGAVRCRHDVGSWCGRARAGLGHRHLCGDHGCGVGRAGASVEEAHPFLM